MTPFRLAIAIALAPGLAHAHAGHWGTLAGHDHWIALGALGLAGLAGAIAIVKGRGRRDEDDAAMDDADAEAEA